jgi:hypothetical protein
MGPIPANSKLQFEIELLNVAGTSTDNSLLYFILGTVVIVVAMFFVSNFIYPLKLVKG